jgi:YD repeat-containing protein
VTTYDQNGKNPMSVTTSYQYNANNLVSTKTETNSKGETIQTSYKYPPDMTDATSIAMTAAHILSPIMQTTVTNNAVTMSTVTSNYYSPSSGHFKTQSVQMQYGTNPVETRQSFYAYDNLGNVNELSKTNDIHEVYLWGYFQQYPVAKITGATLSQVNQYVTQAQINSVTNAIALGTTPAAIDQNLRNLLQPLQAHLPGSLVTIYTYLPVSGITSQLDPRGRITYYQYDNFQRLQLITDNENNVLKTFAYQYAIPQ